MDINYFARGFLFGLLLGWLYLNVRTTRPDKEAKTLYPNFGDKIPA